MPVIAAPHARRRRVLAASGEKERFIPAAGPDVLWRGSVALTPARQEMENPPRYLKFCHVPSRSHARRAATTETISRRSSAPLWIPGSTSRSTQASNEPNRSVNGDGLGFSASSIRLMRR